jgi:hypothetical protein
LVALAVVACGRGTAVTTSTPPTTAASTSTTSSTTTTTTPTTTTADLGPVAPLTGLPTEAPTDRRALAVKIDNFPEARPQSGIPHADLMIELSVEGVTRFVAVFHTGDSVKVGPIRSVRPTDWQIARLFDAPLVISGGQAWVRQRNQSNGAELIGEVGAPYTFRSRDRSAPHNLYGNTIEIRALADQRGYPDLPPQPPWQHGDLPADAAPAETIRMEFTGSLVAEWTWDGRQYLRETNGAVHEWIDDDGNVSQIAVDVLVVVASPTYLAQPPPGGGPARAVETVGEGRAWIFADGRVVEAEWSRPGPDDPFVLTTGEGPVGVPPGKAWLAFIPEGSTPSW